VKRQSKFVAGGALILGVVGYLMVTGMKDSMTYYYTPVEFTQKLRSDPSTREMAARVGGRVVPGSVRWDERTLDLRFTVMDIETGQGRFAVHYQGAKPDTFQEGRDVVVEGQYSQAGVFEATQVLTKCGSRYEAAGSDYKAAAQ
jgi:cytochrome c-type biogenesis protein CcmE